VNLISTFVAFRIHGCITYNFLEIAYREQ